MDIRSLDHKIKKYSHKLQNATTREQVELYHDRLQRYHSMKNSLSGGSLQYGGNADEFKRSLQDQFDVASQKLKTLLTVDLSASEDEIDRLKNELNQVSKSHGELRDGLIDTTSKFSNIVGQIESSDKPSYSINFSGIFDTLARLTGQVDKYGGIGKAIGNIEVLDSLLKKFIESRNQPKNAKEFEKLHMQLKTVNNQLEKEDAIDYVFNKELWSDDEEKRIALLDKLYLGIQKVLDQLAYGVNLGYNDVDRNFTIDVSDEDGRFSAKGKYLDPILIEIEKLIEINNYISQNFYLDDTGDQYQLDTSSEVRVNEVDRKANIYLKVDKINPITSRPRLMQPQPTTGSLPVVPQITRTPPIEVSSGAQSASASATGPPRELSRAQQRDEVAIRVGTDGMRASDAARTIRENPSAYETNPFTQALNQ